MTGSTLIMGRALHAPWNEGARVIGRNLAHSAALFRRVRVLSLTNELFRGEHLGDLPAEHVYSRMPYGVWGDYAGLRRITRRAEAMLAAEQVSAAHLIGLPLALAPWLRRRGVPVVAHATLAGHAYLSRAERLREALAWRVFGRWVDAYACSSESVRAHLERLGCPAHKLRVIPPPVDVQRFRPQPRAEVRQARDIPADAFVVLYVGSVSPLRFPAPQVVAALRAAAEHIPGLRLHVVAPELTHPANRVWVEQNLRRAADWGDTPVTVELRDLSDAEKAELYSSADVLLLPFAAPVAVEPPLTLLEAMACELTPLASPHANRSGIVAHLSNGALYQTPEELAARLRQLHAYGAERQSLFGAAARATVVGRHSIAAVGQALAELWADLPEMPPRRHGLAPVGGKALR